MSCSKIHRIGFIVNPIAGMGGRVGLKGTDGDAYRIALERGAQPVSPLRAIEFLNSIQAECFEIYAAPGVMGAEEVEASRQKNRLASVIGEIRGGVTTRDDTIRIATAMKKVVDALVFVGGDGTARDILEAVDGELPVLGVPSGVKMYSSVFALNPRVAAEILTRFIKGEASIEEREVLDVDEEAFRSDRLSLRIYGYLKTIVYHSLIQASKTIIAGADEELSKKAIAEYIVENMEPGVPYILGPGSTVKAVCRELNIECTLLGVDVVVDKVLVLKDAWEKQLLEILDKYGRAKLIVTPIGGQGFLLGRGNQQISPRVLSRIRREDLVIVATESKIKQLKTLYVDTGDPILDRALEGYYRVVVGYGRSIVVKVSSGHSLENNN